MIEGQPREIPPEETNEEKDDDKLYNTLCAADVSARAGDWEGVQRDLEGGSACFTPEAASKLTITEAPYIKRIGVEIMRKLQQDESVDNSTREQIIKELKKLKSCFAEDASQPQ